MCTFRAQGWSVSRSVFTWLVSSVSCVTPIVHSFSQPRHIADPHIFEQKKRTIEPFQKEEAVSEQENEWERFKEGREMKVGHQQKKKKEIDVEGSNWFLLCVCVAQYTFLESYMNARI